jgi:hypothetical protein
VVTVEVTHVLLEKIPLFPPSLHFTFPMGKVLIPLAESLTVEVRVSGLPETALWVLRVALVTVLCLVDPEAAEA